MPKRFRISDEDEVAPLIPTKRNKPNHKSTTLFSLSSELLLRILSYVPLESLHNVSLTSRSLHRLSLDSGLWRNLYYQRFILPRHAWLSSSRRRQFDLNLPTRNARWLDEANLIQKGPMVDWRRQYRIRHNWAKGVAGVTEISLATEPPFPAMLARLHAGVIFTVDAASGLRAWAYRGTPKMLAQKSLDVLAGGRAPTTIAVDTSRGEEPAIEAQEIFVGFDDGSFQIYEFKNDTFAVSCDHNASSNGALTSCSFSAPFLATMNQSQTLSVYIRDGASVRLLASLKSNTIWPPLSLCLRRVKEELIVAVAYSVPTYLSGWSVGVQELKMTLAGDLIHSRLTTAADNAFEPLHLTHSSADPASVVMPRSAPSSLSYSHPYLLMTHQDNTMTVFLVRSTADSLSIGMPRRLWGHTSSILGVHIGGRGKAVSVSKRGDEVRIWELEGRPGSAFGGQGRTSRGGDGTSSIQVTPEKPASAHELAFAASICFAGFDAENVVIVRERDLERQQALAIYDFA